jgi:hypothetical protein
MFLLVRGFLKTSIHLLATINRLKKNLGPKLKCLVNYKLSKREYLFSAGLPLKLIFWLVYKASVRSLAFGHKFIGRAAQSLKKGVKTTYAF